MNMTTRTEKDQRTLDAIREAGGMRRWNEAPKRHSALLKQGLIVEGSCGGVRYAVLRSEAAKANIRAKTAP